MATKQAQRSNEPPSSRLGEVLHLLDPPPGQPLWAGGATPLGCLRGVAHEQALWRPADGRHSIWDFVLHIAYWKYAVRRKFDGSARGSFSRQPSDWPRVPDPADAGAWKKDRALLREEHRCLVDAVRAFDPRRLDDRPQDGSSYRYADYLYGIVAHDTYHVGQIQLVKRLYQSR